MKTRKIVVVVIESNGAFLLLKRAPWMKYEANLWSVCAGTIEEGESTEQAALREAKEETDLKIKIEKTAEPLEVQVKDRQLTVYPVLAQSESREIKITGEHIAFKWIKPQEFWEYKTVAALEQDFNALGIELGKPAQKKLFR